MRSQSGITITALIVAIIVMIILVGVTVTVAIKDGGLFETAKKAVNTTGEKIEYEQNTLGNDMDHFVQNAIQGIAQ